MVLLQSASIWKQTKKWDCHSHLAAIFTLGTTHPTWHRSKGPDIIIYRAVYEGGSSLNGQSQFVEYFCSFRLVSIHLFVRPNAKQHFFILIIQYYT